VLLLLSRLPPHSLAGLRALQRNPAICISPFACSYALPTTHYPLPTTHYPRNDSNARLISSHKQTYSRIILLNLGHGIPPRSWLGAWLVTGAGTPALCVICAPRVRVGAAGGLVGELSARLPAFQKHTHRRSHQLPLSASFPVFPAPTGRSQAMAQQSGRKTGGTFVRLGPFLCLDNQSVMECSVLRRR
jgi:hypothetical protein